MPASTPTTAKTVEKIDLEPLFNRIIVKRDIVEKSKGGIILPEASSAARPSEGVIIAVGEYAFEDYENVPKPGDKVFWGVHAGWDIKRNGSNYTVLNDEDIIAKVSQ